MREQRPFETGPSGETSAGEAARASQTGQKSNPWQRVAGKVPAQGLALLAIFSVQMGSSVGKGLFHEVGPLGTTFLRLSFAALLFCLLWHPRLRGLTRRQWIDILLFGLSIAGMNGAFYAAISRVPLGIAVTLEFVGPLGLALVQSRRLKDLIWALLALLGIVLLAPVGHTSGIDLLGAGFAVLAGIGWAAYILLSGRVGRTFRGGSGLALAVVVSALFIAPFGIAQGGSVLLQPSVLLIGLAVAILSSVIPFSLEFEALRRLPSRVFGVLMSIEPAVASLIGFLILHEAIELRGLIAIAFVIVASAGASLDGSTHPN